MKIGVSIEPLWNGNLSSSSILQSFSASSLNRTIVEWKYAFASSLKMSIPVVSIEPLWNGNRALRTASCLGSETVSIEPLWNGNTPETPPIEETYPGLNRTIVEWKFRWDGQDRVRGFCLNRTIVEWKFFHPRRL